MPPVGFEPTISAGEQPQTYALDRAATGTGVWILRSRKNSFSLPEVDPRFLGHPTRILANTILAIITGHSLRSASMIHTGF